MVRIIFNGFPEEFPLDNLTIQQLLDITQEDDPAVIVEINGRFIFRQNYATHLINEGDRIEFIHPSFGG
jgi:thiamine biosynthesis protein ThiS